MALRPFAPVGPTLQGSFPLRQAGVVLGASAAGGLALAGSGKPALAFGALAGCGLVIAGIYRPALFLALFLVARPLVDDSGTGITGLHRANLGGALAVLVLAVFGAALASRERLYLPPATPAFVLFLLASGLAAILALTDYSSGVGTDPYAESAKLMALFAVYVLAANLFSTPARAQRLFVIVALSAVLPAIDGISQLIAGPPIIPELGIARISGTFVGPNPFASYLAIAAILLTVLPSEALSRRVRLPALAIILIPLVATYSREGWIMFLAGLVLLHWRRRTALVVGVILATLAIVAVVPGVRERVLPADTSHQARSSTSSNQPTDSFNWRVETWRKLMGKYEESPIVGFGLTTVTVLNPRRYTLVSNRAITVGWEAHNSVVRALFEGGIPLLISLVALFAALISSAARVARRAGPLQWAARTMVVLWVIIVIVGLGTDDPIAQTAGMYALLALSGAVAGASAFAARTDAAVHGTPDA